jgi:hypothetical protein
VGNEFYLATQLVAQKYDVRNINLAIGCECVSGQLTVRKIVLFSYLNANSIAKLTLPSRRLPVSTVFVRRNTIKKKCYYRHAFVG